MKKSKNKTLSAIGVALMFVNEHREQFEEWAKRKGMVLNSSIYTSNTMESGDINE